MFIKSLLIVSILFSLLPFGCEFDSDPEASPDRYIEPESQIVSGDSAKALYEMNEVAILLDVRNQDEYDEGHIKDAMLIPVAELEDRLSELPDKNTVIVVYCRAGRRSALACEILIANGYINVFDMQGMENWPD